MENKMVKLKNLLIEEIRIGDYIIFKGKRTQQGSYWIKNIKTEKLLAYQLNIGTVNYIKKNPDEFLEWIKTQKFI
jgi:hypothetical protein